MDIKTGIEKNGSLLRLEVIGRLETTTAFQLHQAASEIDPASVQTLELDGRNLEYISSAGLREVLFMAKKCHNVCQFRVVNLNDACMEIFSMTGFDSIMSVSKAERDLSTYSHLSFKELLSQKARIFPNRAAIELERGRYTWSELEKCAQIIAADLSALGAGKGSHVAIYGANSVNWICTFFAIQKLGGIAILLNPSLKTEEIVLHSHLGDIDILCCGEGQIFDEAARALLLGEQSQIKALYDIRKDRCFMDRMAEYEAVKDQFTQTVMADDPAVMIFSSGSTGRPKGVLLSAFNLLNSADYMNRESLHTTDQDSICLILPLFHIFGLVVGLLSNFVANSRVVLPGDTHSGTIIECIERSGCTVLHAVPTLLLAMVNNKGFDPEKVKSLRCTVIAGAAATEAQIRLFQEKMPNNDFFSAYGLSELAPATITRPHDSFYHLTKTVGKAVKNVEVRITDRESGRVCGVGEQGEVELRGFNLMVCYYKMDLQDQTFDPEGWLKTGDMGYLDEDGYLHLTGRFKDMIIRGGENIIPAEIAGVMTEHPAVEDCVVVGAPSEFYGEEVAACVKLHANEVFDREELLRFVGKRLARFKVPSYVFLYEDFPHLPNGKIDMVNLRGDVVRKVSAGAAEGGARP